MSKQKYLQREIEIAQNRINQFAPGKVKVTVEPNPDFYNVYILCGEYQCSDGTYSTWTEQIDRYYTDCDLFVGFFRQRAKWLNATLEQKQASDVHPAMYGETC